MSRVLATVALVAAVAGVAGSASAGSASSRTTPKWSVAASEDFSPGYVINDVSCVTATDCWAVGDAFETGINVTRSIAEHWNGTAWSLAQLPKQTDDTDELLSVSCPTTDFCMALGHTTTSGDTNPLFEMWNGKTWTGASSYLPDGELMQSVSCTSSKFCIAVGQLRNAAQCPDGGGSDPGYDVEINEWGGGLWQKVSAPSPGSCGSYGFGDNGKTDALNAVSCVSPTDCLAAGSLQSGRGAGGQLAPTNTLTESFNGTTWSYVPSLSPSSTDNDLDGLDCTSEKFCMTVGGDQPSGSSSDVTLAETWNGSSWTVINSPTATQGDGELRAVGCANKLVCFAVGVNEVNGESAAADRWNGSSLTAVAAPRPGLASQYQGVSCPSRSSCQLVGHFSKPFAAGAGIDDGLDSSWNGRTFTHHEFRPPGHVDNQLLGVSCPTNSECVQSGDFDNPTPTPLIETEMNGTPAIGLPAPSPSYSDTQLLAVNCFGGKTCTAVGHIDTLSGDQTLAERWNGGKTWQVQTTPTEAYAGKLSGVSCPTKTMCMAVGDHDEVAPPHTDVVLSELWTKGGGWTTVEPPDPSGLPAVLSSVSCLSPTRCIAVGSYLDPSSANRSLALRWNGTTWHPMKVASPSPHGDVLSSVTCPAIGRCVAVGTVTTTSSTRQLVEVLKHGHWSYTTAHAGASLNSVACRTAVDCMAVGSVGAPGATKTLIETWRGKHWTVSKSRNRGSGPNVLNGVDCTKAQCEAVGSYQGPGKKLQTLVERLPT